MVDSMDWFREHIRILPQGALAPALADVVQGVSDLRG